MRKIIGEAWDFTQSNKKMIMWYALIPSFLTTLVGMFYLVYQYYAFLSSPIFENWERSFSYYALANIYRLVMGHFQSLWPLIIVAIIATIFYFLIPSFCEGSIIQLLARKRNGQDVKTRDGIRFGILYFLPIFEYSLFVKTFSITSLMTWLAFVLRNLGWDWFYFVLPFFAVMAVAGIILTLLFTYTEFFIVIDDRGVMEAVAKSTVLVVTHLEETILLTILMLIIGLRIIVQLLFVLLIPAIMVLLAYLFASTAIPSIGLIVGGIAGLVMLYLAAYLSGIIHVFAASVWVFTFLDLTNLEEESARNIRVIST